MAPFLMGSAQIKNLPVWWDSVGVSPVKTVQEINTDFAVCGSNTIPAIPRTPKRPTSDPLIFLTSTKSLLPHDTFDAWTDASRAGLSEIQTIQFVIGLGTNWNFFACVTCLLHYNLNRSKSLRIHLHFDMDRDGLFDEVSAFESSASTYWTHRYSHPALAMPPISPAKISGIFRLAENR